MNLFALISLTVSICCFLLAIFVFTIGKGRLHRTWAIFNTVVGLWSLGIFFAAISKTPLQAALSWKFAYLPGTFISIVFYNFVYVFCNFKKIKKTFIIIYVQGIIFCFVIIFTRLFINSLEYVFSSIYYHKATSMFVFWFTIWAIVTCSAFYKLHSFIVRTKGAKRTQALYLFWSMLLGFTGGTASILPSFGILVYPALHFSICIYFIIVTYAILKHHLMDINIVFKKGVIYSSLIAIITAVYLLFVISIGKICQDVAGYKSFVVNLIAVFIIALLFNPLRDKIQRFLDHRFFKGTLESLSQEQKRLKEELFNSEKLASIGQLASSIVHEIKNPIQAIKAFTQYLPKKYDDPEFRKKFFDIIPREVDKINSITHQLLDLAKPKPPQFKDTNLHLIIDSTLNLLENNFKDNKIAVKTNFYPEEIIIQADSDQLRQVFLNLFLNAMDAMSAEENGGTLTITTGLTNENNNFNADERRLHTDNRGLNPRKSATKSAVIRVQDTGKGISPENLNEIFEPFFTTKEKGTGLGLALVRQIIENHKGKINVESEMEKGTEFIITLPFNCTKL